MAIRFSSALLAGAVATTIVTTASNAQAISLDFAGSNLKSVTGLNVNGTIFDVDFASQNFNGAFNGSTGDPFFLTSPNPETDATAAASALIAVLNDQANGFVNNPNSTFADGARTGFLIPFLTTVVQGQGPNNDTVTSIVGIFDSVNGIVNPSGNLLFGQVDAGAQAFSYAVFTVDEDATAAIPTPALLPGLLGFGMSIVRKRKKQQEDSLATA